MQIISILNLIMLNTINLNLIELLVKSGEQI